MAPLRERLSADGGLSDAGGLSDGGGPGRSLAFVMGLPLVDGVFATLVLAGALSTVTGIVQTGLLVFGGAATAALLLSSGASRRDDALRVARVAAVIVPLAAVQAAVAPAFAAVLDATTFRPFAGLVLLAVAARVASAHVTRYLPAPGLVVLVGVLVSFQPAPIQLTPDATAALRAAAAAGVGVAFALGVVAGADLLERHLDADRFRFGSAVALGILGASVAGVVSPTSPLPLVALVLAAVLSLDPSGGPAEPEETDPVRNESYP